MLVDDVHTALQKVFKETLQTSEKIDAWLHFHTDIYVTSLCLFAS
jgi:hypothetical protein